MTSGVLLRGSPKTIRVPRALLSNTSKRRSISLRLRSSSSRPGLFEGTRELVEHPYIIVYKVFEDTGEIVVVSAVHGARRA